MEIFEQTVTGFFFVGGFCFLVVFFSCFFCRGEILPQVLRKAERDPDEEEEDEMPDVSTNPF